MIPIAAWLGKAAIAKALWKRAEQSRAAEVMDRYRYAPPPISLRGLGGLLVVLIITHSVTYVYAKWGALAAFKVSAERVAARQLEADRKVIADLEAELAKVRGQEEAVLRKMREQEESTLREIEEAQARLKASGWAPETVRAINGDRK